MCGLELSGHQGLWYMWDAYHFWSNFYVTTLVEKLPDSIKVLRFWFQAIELVHTSLHSQNHYHHSGYNYVQLGLDFSRETETKTERLLGLEDV